MTDTTKKLMTLEQVSDWHRKEAIFQRGFGPNNSMIHRHDEMADAIDANIAAQPRAAVTVTDEMVKSFEDMYKKVDTYPGFVGLRKSAVRAALEAVLKGK